MSEYIARDAAIAIIEEKQKELCPVGRYSRHYVYGTDRERFDAWQEIIDALVPSKTADVEEVVRCKDCKHKLRTVANGFVICREKHGMVRPSLDDFCSYGERREE
jgi:hypothetical protein